jgi:hypothetical protein
MSIYLTNTVKDNNISLRNHKAKKNHTCVFCQNQVKKGTQYTKTVGTFDGYFVSNAWHNQCFKDHSGYVDDQQRKE